MFGRSIFLIRFIKSFLELSLENDAQLFFICSCYAFEHPTRYLYPVTVHMNFRSNLFILAYFLSKTLCFVLSLTMFTLRLSSDRHTTSLIQASSVSESDDLRLPLPGSILELKN